MSKVLILGGTNFIGRNLIDELQRHQEYELTLFNRGLSNPNLYPEITKIQGDRNTKDVKQIANES